MSREVSIRRKRATLKSIRPNPLFDKWLQEWKDEAASRGSDMQYCFGKALNSLRRYPLCLKTGKECGVLKNFGTRLCVMLDRKLAEYRKDHPEGENSVGEQNVAIEGISKEIKKKRPKSLSNKKRQSIHSQKTPGKPRSVTRKRKYAPARRSGAYALLLTLINSSKEPQYPGYMSKAELLSLAQPLCDTSLTKPEYGSHYTAWSSMSSLIKKGLATRNSCPARYALTAEGEALAQELQEKEEDDAPCPVESHSDTPTVPAGPVLSSRTECANMGIRNSSKETKVSPQKNKNQHHNLKATAHTEATSILVPESFDVLLLVDTAETLGGVRKVDESVSYLRERAVNFEVRHLKVGDFAWVLQDKTTGCEMVLPYIVERKRIDDLSKSITDGRFHEQKNFVHHKLRAFPFPADVNVPREEQPVNIWRVISVFQFRLKQSGIQNLIYLVERHGKDMHTAVPLKTLNQAAVNTQVIDGFTVKYTANLRESMGYLATLTRLLGSMFQKKTLVNCPKNNLPPFNISDELVSLMTFDEFNKSSGKLKNFQVSEMFTRHLVQLYGLSVEKALAIVQQYPTPRTLVAAYQSGGGEKLLAGISHGSLSRILGPVISKAIYQLYTNTTLS